ncbi:MAG: YggT family protein [Thermoanaerobaculia bacterium]
MNFAQGFGWSLLEIVFGLMSAYTWVIIIRALLSWVNPDPYNPIVRLLVGITEPVLRPLRKLAPPHKMGGLDLSPMIAILLIQLIRNGLLYSLGLRVRGLF